MSWLPVATLFASLALTQTSPPAGTPAAAPAPLSVMSFNVRYGTATDGDNHWLKRREHLFALLRDRSPDVVGLQEALHHQLVEIIAAVPGYDYVGVGRADGRQDGEYAAILYKTSRLRARRSDTFWLSDTPGVVASKTWGNRIERVCTWAYLEDRLGAPFFLYNVHLDHESQPSRERSVALLLERIRAQLPASAVIVTGDLNAGEQNPAVVAMRTAFGDSFRARHPDAKEVGTFTGFKFGNTAGEKIDYVFVGDGVDVVEAEIVRDARDGRYPSDHFPVTATVRVR